MVELMYAALITSVADMSELKKETPISLAIPESPSEKEDQKKCKPIPDLDPSASVVSSVNIFNGITIILVSITPNLLHFYTVCTGHVKGYSQIYEQERSKKVGIGY